MNKSANSFSANDELDLNAQNTNLLTQLNAALHAQRSAMKQVLEMDQERWRRGQAERIKREKKRQKRTRRIAEAERRRAEVMKHSKEEGGGGGVVMSGKKVELKRSEKVSDQEEDKEQEGEDGRLSSSTDEMTDSD